MNKISKSLSIKDFAEAFGTDEGEIHRFCGDLIKSMNFKYEICSQVTREKILFDVIKKYDDAKLSVSGSHRRDDWRRGWGEILQEFHVSGGDLKTLAPKYLHGDRPSRYKGNYIVSNSNSFEHDFALVFKHWLYKKYFGDYENIYEFG